MWGLRGAGGGGGGGCGGKKKGQGFQLVKGGIFFHKERRRSFFLGCAVLKQLTYIGYFCTTNSFCWL